MITNKKNLKAHISKKGKYHIAHIQILIPRLNYMINNKNRGVGRSSKYYISIYNSITYFQYSPITIAIDSNSAIVNSSNG